MGMRLVICLRPFTLNILVTPLDTEGNSERGLEEGRSGKRGRKSGGAGGGGGAGQREGARVSLSKYKPVESYIVSWRVLGMSTLQSMLHTTLSTEFNFH